MRCAPPGSFWIETTRVHLAVAIDISSDHRLRRGAAGVDDRWRVKDSRYRGPARLKCLRNEQSQDDQCRKNASDRTLRDLTFDPKTASGPLGTIGTIRGSEHTRTRMRRTSCAG